MLAKRPVTFDNLSCPFRILFELFQDIVGGFVIKDYSLKSNFARTTKFKDIYFNRIVEISWEFDTLRY